MAPIILQEPHQALRTVAADVPAPLFGSAELAHIIADMSAALDGESDGVAIAAPQIGISYRIFIVSKKINKKWKNHKIFINPTITKLGKEKKDLTEGCLSVRYKYGLISRSMSASVRAYTEQGNEFAMNGRGLLAQIFQHETDHLRGKLFIDTAHDIVDNPPSDSNANVKTNDIRTK